MSNGWASIVVDVESTGLDCGPHGLHVAVEVAWCDLGTDEVGEFIPAHTEADIALAEPRALEINHYHDRLAGRRTDDGLEVGDLHERLIGATIAGSAPSSVDMPALNRLFADYHLPLSPWHHHPLDLGTYAMHPLGLAYVPGLAEVCSLLGVDAPDHSAAGDVRATVACFAELGLPARLREEATA